MQMITDEQFVYKMNVGGVKREYLVQNVMKII
jgi:hypothetical protein